jgi:hypothetical protein
VVGLVELLESQRVMVGGRVAVEVEGVEGEGRRCELVDLMNSSRQGEG